MRKAYRFQPKKIDLAPKYRINEFIRVPEVRLIDDAGQMQGVVPTADALKMAREKGMDLVEVAPLAQPPVAKILDFGKFQYQQEKLARKAKAAVKKVETKGIRLSLRIGDHDRDFRLNQAKGFIEEGNKVKVEIPLRGREHQHTNLAREIIKQFVTELHALVPVTTEQGLEKNMGRLSMIVAPESKKQ